MKNTTEKQIITMNDGKFYTTVGTFAEGECFEDANHQKIMLKDDGKLYVLFNGVFCPYNVEFEIIEPETESEEEIKKQKLNEAIYEVLSTAYKKDCKEAHDLVKEAGYEIEKWNGCWHVKNLETERCVSIERFPRGFYISHSSTKGMSKCSDKFDFVACLNKPRNTTYRDMMYEKEWSKNKAYTSYEKLRRAKWSVSYHTDSIADAERELEKAFEKYESSIQYHTKAQKESAEALTKLRKELGLAS